MPDIVAQTVSLLSGNWNPANTAGVTPTIDEVWDHKRFLYKKTAQNNGDGVFCYSVSYTQQPSGVNFTHVNSNDMVTVDVRTMVTRAHAILLRDEILRIFGIFKEPFTGQNEVEVEDIQDKGQDFRGLWRFVFMLRYFAYHVPRV